MLLIAFETSLAALEAAFPTSLATLETAFPTSLAALEATFATLVAALEVAFATLLATPATAVSVVLTALLTLFARASPHPAQAWGCMIFSFCIIRSRKIVTHVVDNEINRSGKAANIGKRVCGAGQ